MRPLDYVTNRQLNSWTCAATSFFKSLIEESRSYVGWTDCKRFNLALDILTDSIPLIIEDTDLDIIFQEAFVEQRVGLLDEQTAIDAAECQGIEAVDERGTGTEAGASD
jgi:hypothetical protein